MISGGTRGSGLALGSLLNAKYPCGYKKRGLVLGAGRLNYDKSCKEPALCEICTRVVTIDLMAKVLR